jgi:hypothetical protein
MNTKMADRLSVARQRSFVGRTAELQQFSELLGAPELPVAVLYVHGPAGVGKSTLLRRFASLCDGAGITCLAIDARDLPPGPEGLMARMTPALQSELQVAARTRTVVLLDTYELLSEVDGWIREELLPQLPADTLVVIAGQNAPNAGWRTDPGWAELVRTLPLRNLTPDESSAYLRRKHVSDSMHRQVVDFTHGHPLALALVSEVLQSQGTFTPRDSPNVIKVLVDRLVQVVPSPAHRRALEASAQVRVTTEPLLAALLEVPDAADLFGWLRALPFVDSGTAGLHLHDLARDVLAADLQWRHPERFVELHARARQHYLSRLDTADSAGQAALLLDLMFLHADLRQFLRPPEPAGPGGGFRIEQAVPDDLVGIRSMVARHEGEASALLAEHWFARQPQAWQVVRDLAGAPVGLLCLLAIAETTAQDRQTDPAIEAAWQQLRAHAPLRPGERATMFRFWLARDSYQAISPIQSLIAVQLARYYLTTAALAVTLLPFAEPEKWVEFCGYADQTRMPDADFTVGGHSYGVYGHDWRVVTPAAWLGMLSQRETGSQSPAQPDNKPVLLVLGEADFATAVRRALRDFTRPDRLRDNQLINSRLITTRTSEGASVSQRVGALQDAIREAAETLRASAADEKLYRVLHRAYFAPAPTLERAAEVLDLPSSTFRRYLSSATARVVAALWHQELQA